MATFGTRLLTWLKGERAGEDALGNRYYRDRTRPRYGRERRWVIYRGDDDASAVPPGWHAWLHHMAEEPPAAGAPALPWYKPHRPNPTGTPAAYYPPGSVRRGGRRDHATGDYEPWRPE